jgi:hypothetical protein
VETRGANSDQEQEQPQPQPQPPADSQRRPNRNRNRNRNLGSSLLFAALAIVLAAAAYILYQEDDPSEPPVPAATPGHYELIQVRDALDAQGLDATLGQGAFLAEGLTPPGQFITLGGDAAVYAFIYPDTAAQAAEATTLDPATLAITTPSRRPVAGVGSDQTELHIAAGSNVIAVLVGGSPEQIEQFDAAIASLV